jgi:hypothetical protein
VLIYIVLSPYLGISVIHVLKSARKIFISDEVNINNHNVAIRIELLLSDIFIDLDLDS